MGAIFLVSPLQAPRKASPCSLHSQLHCWLRVRPVPHLSALLWSQLLLLGSKPYVHQSANEHFRKDPQETPARTGQTGYVCLTLPPSTLMFHPDFLILSALLLNS